MFVDEVVLRFIAGNGGNGAIMWRREAHVPKGGPFGGNGGRGGDVILFATNDRHTLYDFRHKKEIRAQDGEKGDTKLMHGANGADLRIPVPVGTVIRDVETQEVIFDLNQLGMEFLLCRGGRGGYGNHHFLSSTRQAPEFAELGDHGEFRTVILELKLVADIALVGFPNAGKSTLISTLTNAKPKIANYPFTTLVPNLGIMEWQGKSVVLEDVPGLIEGASEGKGLGIQFLRHIERAGVILHLIDISDLDECVQKYKTIRNELKKYSRSLAQKEEIIVLTKADTVEEDIADLVRKAIKKVVKTKKVFVISAAAHSGLDELRAELILHKHDFSAESGEKEDKKVVYDIASDELPNSFRVFRTGKFTYEVKGRRIQQIARMTMMDNREGIMRVWDVLYKIGALRDIARLAEKELLSRNSIDENRYNIFAKIPEGKVVINDRVFSFEDVGFMFSNEQQ